MLLNAHLSGYPARNTLTAVTLPSALGDRAKETICLIVDTSSEEKGISSTREATIAEA